MVNSAANHGAESAADSTIPRTEILTIEVDGQRIRAGIHRGSPESPPLLIFNGIGANLELVEPFTAALGDIESVVFDVPGTGGSPAPILPYRLFTMASLANRLMGQLGYTGQIDVLGVSWGGALAQQFARQYPERCRRLVLAATAPGAVMIPGRLSALGHLLSPRRSLDRAHLGKVGPSLYGGTFRKKPELLLEHIRHIQPPRGRGYSYQLLAAWGWTSIFWLRSLRQPTLLMAGTDDPIVPVINAKIMARLIPKTRLYVIDDGHLFLVARASEVAPVVRQFLREIEPT
jgi:poly(3-hydroxyalkanoate) depolymerase